MSIMYWAPMAWLPDGIAHAVRIEVAGGRIAAIVQPAEIRPGDIALPGLTLPGLANAHSHAFHRALRGRTHGQEGTFWTWRRAMYRAAGRLDPETYRSLATAVFAEMTLAGYTAVGEFHYVHHHADGSPYAPANAMGLALVEAAAAAGIRITLLDTCYLAGGIGAPPAPEQRRFSDSDAKGWIRRTEALASALDALPAGPRQLGAALHSVRAVPRSAIAEVARAAQHRGQVLHVHVSEQPQENADCLAAYGHSPMAVLDQAGALTPSTCLVHAVHVTREDIALAADGGANVCLCPTTERDLGDGIAPATRLRQAGVPLSLGSDQHVEIDPFAEARALEADERLAAGQRGVFAPAALLGALSRTGYRALGWPEAELRAGAAADFVAVRTDSVRTAGCEPEQLIMAAGAPDVDTVVVAGERVVVGGKHRLGDVGALLRSAIEKVAP